MKLKAVLSGLLFFTSGCAVLHHVQVGSIDTRNQNQVWVPFDMKMSEAGINTQEIGAIAKSANTQGGDNVAGIAAIVSMFQMGPRTGNTTYNDKYAEKLVYEIYQKCPSGRVTGLTSVREMRKYPVVSGEIVKVTGFCAKTRVQAKTDSGEI